jgi:undecaprenyl-diphosphatase
MIRDPAHHHHSRLFEEHRWALAGAAALYLVATTLFVVMAVDPGILQPLDDWWYDRMFDLEAAWVTGLAKAMDIIGGAYVMWPLRLGMTAFLAVRRRWVLLTYWVLTALSSEVAIGLLKNAYGRPRPPSTLVETTGASFPSGHAVATAATVFALVIVLLAPGAHRRIWEIRAGLFALVMAMSRPYLRAHWLTDALAGLLLGAATALALAALADEIRERMGLTPPAPP